MRQMAFLRVFVLLLAMSASTTTAQPLQSGEVFGRVTDTQQAALPGVTVTLEGPSLLQPMTMVTSPTGAYRFPEVPIGTYTVRFELTGFQRLVREGIIITTGFNAQLDVSLGVSGLEETVTVSGVTPVVDTRSTTQASTFTREALDGIPSPRDPWAILEQTPGMVMTRQNVGGTTSGQQPGFLARGSATNQMWNLDGASITDMPDNTSPGYYDFDMFEEIQIQTGGNDASQDAGGVVINLVTKSGGNTFRGTSRFFFTDQALQSDNVTDELRAQGAGAGNPLKRIEDYGFEVGGPIKRNKAWFWGSYSKVDIDVGVIGFLKPGATDPNDPDSLMSDLTELENANAKLQYQWQKAHRTTFLYAFGDKIRNARGAGPLNPIETTTPQSGPSHMFKFEHTWIVGSALMLVPQGYFTGQGGWVQDFQSPELASIQPSLDIVTGMNGRSARRDEFVRPSGEVKLDGNYFRGGWLGGDHSMKFGVRYRDTPYETMRQVGGGAIARFRNGVPSEAEISRDGYLSRALWSWSAYINDSYRRDRLTINGGIRFDYQDDEALPTSTVANPILPDLLPALDFQGADSGASYKNWSPRFGVTYDVTGDARTVLKGNLARYYGIGIFTASTLSPTDRTWLRYPWADLNGDRFVQRNELDLTRLLSSSTNYDPANPTSGRSAATVDPGLENDITDEFTIGLDRELVRDFAVSATYIWRRYHNLQDSYRIGLQSASFVPVPFTAACGNTSCDQPSYSVTYWQLPFQQPAATILRNNEQRRSYQGFEVAARKRFTNRWMLNGSFTFNDTKFFYAGGPDVDYQDPTNVAQQDGEQVGTSNSRWVAKLTGLYVLPWDISVSGFLNARDGYPFNRTVLTPTRTGGLGTASVLVTQYAEERYDDFVQFDARVDKTVKLGPTQWVLSLDVFNVFNSNVVLGAVARQNASNANFVTTILAPRVLRFGVRLKF